jgi:hypothetical protein
LKRPNCEVELAQAASHCPECGAPIGEKAGGPAEKDKSSEMLLSCLFIAIGIPSLCLGSCFLSINGQRIEPVSSTGNWSVPAFVFLAIPVVLLALLIYSKIKGPK